MSNDIIKFLGFEDSNIEIIDSIYQSNQRIITLQKRLIKHYCPVCSHIMHSKGIYTRTINHPIMQDGRQLIIKLNQRRWKCTNPICGFTQNDEFSFIEPYRRNTDEVYIDIDFKHKYALVIQDIISGKPIDMLPSRRQEITEP